MTVALPPGRAAMPVAGIPEDINPKLAAAAGELNAWIDYLLHPETHDGPRIYRPKHPETGPDARDFESPRRMPPAGQDAPWENPDEYETLSVLHDFAADTSVCFKPAQAVSGISTPLMDAPYEKLTQGCLTWYSEHDVRAPGDDDGEEQKQPPPTRYPELHPARVNWTVMRKTWTSNEDVYATLYEWDFLNYQLVTENCLYAVAEHLVRYRAILHKAGEDVEALMKAMVELCPKPAPPGEGSFNLMSVLVTGIVAVATTVISGGTGTTVGVLLGVAVAETIGEAIKTAERTGAKTELLLDNKYYLADVARQYLAGVQKIERDTANAVEALRDGLRRELDELREHRQHPEWRRGTPGAMTGVVPYFRDYV